MPSPSSSEAAGSQRQQTNSSLSIANVSSVSAGPRTRSSKKRALDVQEDNPQPSKRKRARLASVFSSGKMTAGDRERLEALRRQPLVTILDRLYVQCKRCGGRIKLSESCLYDPAHWATHRARCDRWSDAQVVAKREKNAMGVSRPSTPELTPDDDSELTELSVDGETRKSRSPSPAPPAGTASGEIVQGPLTAHVNCVEYFELAHPGLEVIDLNAPLPTIPTWSFERLKLQTQTRVAAGQAEDSEHRRRCALSAVNWDELDFDDEDSEYQSDGGPQRSPEPSPGPCTPAPLAPDQKADRPITPTRRSSRSS